jgi:hypothetical protein
MLEKTEGLRDGLMATEEDLSIVLIQSTLVVTNSWHVLNDNGVIRVFAFLVENSVGFDHVVDNVRLGNLLGTELLLGTQVLSIIVSEVVVAGNGSEPDTSVDQEVNEGGLHLGLARLEVITTNERIVLLGKVNGTWNKGVLGRSVDEWNAFQNTGDSKHGGWRDLLVTILDSLEEVVSGVIDAGNEVSETLGVGSP